MVNKSVKVYSEDYHNHAENYTFKWMPPKGPDDSTIPFDLKNDMLIFSPDKVGNYEIHLSITDIADEIIAEEVFYYLAVEETTAVAIAEPLPKPKPEVKPKEEKKVAPPPIKKSKKKSSSKKVKLDSPKSTKIPDKHLLYTVQVSARPSLEKARIDQLQLLEEGFDAYIQRHYRNDKDAVWYRVRVGSFNDKTIAAKVKRDIDSFLGINSWIDLVKSEESN
ncbi:MAG: SPOR domain-containing protein [Candidatus Marinimicrobia bacterium]|nr:SPOR domain-containing protein [Candidatus Neomarinimicrobiota bacterium]